MGGNMNLSCGKRQRVLGILLALVAMGITGCSVLLGPETVAPQQGFSFRPVETLRNEASLRGESLKEVALNTDRATTLQQPNSVYADDFRVYVVDRTPGRIFVFDRGARKTIILDGTPPPPEDEVQLLAPASITVNALGTMFVSDTQQGKVFGFDRNGKLIMVIGKLGELGTPAGLAIDQRRNRLYVADTSAHQVKVFSTTGDRLFEDGLPSGGRPFEIGASGKSKEDFKFPGAIALDANGDLFVLDTLRKRVHVYAPDGKFIKVFALSGSMPGQAIKPKGLAVDSDGHLYVTDSVSNNILLFDREGTFLATWGRTGILTGEFWTPAGIFIDSRDTIYIADQMNGRVQSFQYTK
jgi:DNA-binding beta-propeller fold protein YncE